MIMIAQETGLEPGVFTTRWAMRMYLNHVEGLRKQLEREPMQLPEVRVARKPLDSICFEDVELVATSTIRSSVSRSLSDELPLCDRDCCPRPGRWNWEKREIYCGTCPGTWRFFRKRPGGWEPIEGRMPW